MPSYVSPGVYVVEKDISDYPVSINSSVIGIVGFASKGPIAGIDGERATLVTSQNDLIRVFGEPSEDITGQALEGALEVLETTNSIRFIRCASGALQSSAAVPVGLCPAFHVSGRVDDRMITLGTDDAAVSSVRLTATVWDNTGTKILTDKVVTIPSGTIGASSSYNSSGHANTAALKKVLGGGLDSSKIIATGGTGADASAFIVGAAAGSGAYMDLKVEIYNSDSANWVTCSAAFTPLNAIGEGSAAPTAASLGQGALNGAATAVRTHGTTAESTQEDGVALLVQGLYPGKGYDAGTKDDGTTSGHSVDVNVRGAANFEVQVNDQGVASETFKCSFLSGEPFIETQIGATVATKTSEWIVGRMGENKSLTDFTTTKLSNFYDRLSTLGSSTINGWHGADNSVADMAGGRFAKLVQGTYSLADGTNGIEDTDPELATILIGEEKSDGGKTGMQALDDDLLNISIAMCPHGTTPIDSVQNALITLAEGTQNFIALVAPPYAVGRVGDAIEWHNGLDDNRSAAINSSYAACYWPWLKVFSVHDGADRWYSPEIFAARQMAFTDSVADPWFAPAGYVRGRLTKPTDVELALNQGDRDSLYSGGNVINPIVNFPQQGITIFGQRTTQRDPTALDRVNVRRMLIVIRKMILASTRRLVFEPNDQFTWSRVEDLINPMLDDIKRRRGITDFRVVCDSTTNTPVRIDRNEMWTKVIIKPTKTAEMVVFEINITNQTAQLGKI